jgi:enoyl-CoA hydratase/carnithine racemase
MNAAPDHDQPFVLTEDQECVHTLTMNRPQRLNLLSSQMLQALQDALDVIARDRRVRVVVLAGAGKGFCAGHDLREIQALKDQPKIEQLFGACSHMMQSIQALPQPVIARVHGPAAAAGCQLVAQCDLAVASEIATFAMPGVTWGFFCSTPGVAAGRNLQRKHAMEMLLTGETIEARRAMEWGLINRVVPADQLDAAVRELALKIAEKPPFQVASGKRAFYEQIQMRLGDAYEFAGRVIADAFAQEEGRQGMKAFIEKRPPPKE